MVNCTSNSCSYLTPAHLNDDQLNEISELMRPGRLCLDGFIGLDDDLTEVYEKDSVTLQTLGVTHFDIGHALATLAEQALSSKTKSAVVGNLTVTVDDNSGENPITCPFQQGEKSCHFGMKLFRVFNASNKQTLHFSELAIGLILDHAFFENCEKYRVDPCMACAVLELPKKSVKLAGKAEISSK